MEDKNHPLVNILILIGFLVIIGGVVVGLSTYNVEVIEEGVLTDRIVEERDWLLLIQWVAYGLIGGVLFFSIAKTLTMLIEMNDRTEQSRDALMKVKHELEKMNDNK